MKRVSFIPPIFFIIFFLLFPFRAVQVASITFILLYLSAYIISMLMKKSIIVSRGMPVYYCQNGVEDYSSIEILNSGIIPMENIVISDKGAGCYDNGIGTFVDNISSRNSKSFSCRLNTLTRGNHVIGPVVVKGSDPFNLFPWKKVVESYSNVVIYPRFYPIELLLTEGEIGGRQKVKNPLYEDLSDLKSMREFRQGDSLKRVNWKASAKAGQLQTMEFSNTLSAPLFILLDLKSENYPIKQRYIYIERAIEAASSLAVSYGERGESCGLFTNAGKDGLLIPQSKGYGNTISILENLASIDFRETSSKSVISGFSESRNILPQGSHLYILVPELTPELNNEIEILKAKKYIIKIVITGGGGCEIHPPGNCKIYYLTSYGREYFRE